MKRFQQFYHDSPFVTVCASRAMVRDQIVSRGIRDKRVLKAMLEVERQSFVPPEAYPFAYADTPLPIGFNQTISQPYIVALMTELLALEPSDKVLEIGTGSGYQTAILASIAEIVYTVELIEELHLRSSAVLRSLGYKNIHSIRGDGYSGHPDAAPYNAIIVTAAPPTLPDKLNSQLAVGGRMLIPIGETKQTLYLFSKTPDGSLSKREILAVKFVPLIHSGEKAPPLR